MSLLEERRDRNEQGDTPVPWSEETRIPTVGKPTLVGGWARTVGQGKDGNRDLQQIPCLPEPQSPPLFNGEKEVYYLPPHFTEEEAEIKLRPSGYRAQVLRATTLALQRVCCKPSSLSQGW